MDQVQIEDIAIALHRHEWLPSPDERALAAAFFQRLKALPKRQLLPVPDGAGSEPAWAERVLALSARADLAARLLAETDLSGPMTTLLGEVARRCGAFHDVAEGLRSQWQEDPPREPTAEELRRGGDRAHAYVLSLWDLAHVSEADRQRAEAADSYAIMTVQSTMMAALSGDTEW